MYLFVLAPMFSSSGSEEVTRRKREWKKWWKDNEDALIDEFNLHRCDSLGLAPGRRIKIGKEKPVILSFPKAEEALVQKGLAVRFCVLVALDRSDERGVDQRNDAAFVLIDGSGAFDFSGIFMVLRALRTADVVFGLRPEGNSGMSEWRRIVEDFEQFVLFDNIKLDVDCKWNSKNLLPDGQAGCWGFWLRSLRHFALTAPSYEIEFDILASAVMSKLKIAFTPELKMKTRGKSDFGVDPDEASIGKCIEKMRFIVHKLKLKPQAVLLSQRKFCEQHPAKGKSLPLSYTQALRAAFSPIT